MNPAYRIESMQLADLPAVCTLETVAGMSTFGATAFAGKMQQASSILLVARAPQVVAMFSGWVVLDELEVDNLVVALSQRRQGIGAALLRATLRQACELGAQTAVLEVRLGNLAAQRLYQSFGFAAVGQRRDYYRDPQEDALIMRCEDLPAWAGSASGVRDV